MHYANIAVTQMSDRSSLHSAYARRRVLLVSETATTSRESTWEPISTPILHLSN
jgi:hypothetical protein